MRKVSYIISAILSSSVWATEFQVVDIGFHDFDKHIAIELTTLNGEDALAFSLSSNTTERSVAINKCVYTQSSLEREVNKIQNPKVKSDFNWIFFRSDYSSSPVSQFYPEFKALLERANPTCPVPELQQLKDQLDSQKG